VEANGVHDQTVSWGTELISYGLGDRVKAGFKEDEGACIHQKEHDEDLEECLAKHLSPDFSQENLVSAAYSIRFTLVLFVGLSSNGNCSKDIHNQVGPKHLYNVQRSVTKSAASKNSNEADNDVDCKLELDELPHIIKDCSSPFDRSVDRDKIIIQNDKV
jgi:hypothetical protein